MPFEKLLVDVVQGAFLFHDEQYPSAARFDCKLAQMSSNACNVLLVAVNGAVAVRDPEVAEDKAAAGTDNIHLVPGDARVA